MYTANLNLALTVTKISVLESYRPLKIFYRKLEPKIVDENVAYKDELSNANLRAETRQHSSN